MTTTTQTRGKSDTDMSFNYDGFDVKSIKSIQLSDGWHNISDCTLVQFAIGESHSPMYPSKLYPTLRYKNENGTDVWTPLSNILSYSDRNQV